LKIEFAQKLSLITIKVQLYSTLPEASNAFSLVMNGE